MGKSQPSVPTINQRLQINTIQPSEVLVEIIIFDVSHMAVLDTGAAVSVMSSNLLPNVVVRPTSHSLFSVQGKPLVVLGLVTLPILINNTSFEHDFFVCGDILGKCLIGADFLIKYELSLDFKAKCLSSDQFSVPIQCKLANSRYQQQMVQPSLHIEHRIHCQANTRPIYSRPYRTPLHLQEEVQKQVSEILAK
jgi:hypothetical protein